MYADENEPATNDRSSLGNLYPEPKSYGELMKKRKAAEAARLSRLPKHVILRTGAQVYVVLAALGLLVERIPHIVAVNVMSGVFFSFLLGLAWLGCALWATSNISRYFQQLGHSAVPFFILYACSFPPLAFAVYQLTAESSFLLFFAATTCLHFIVASILAKIILR